jgi:hypothetical protein
MFTRTLTAKAAQVARSLAILPMVATLLTSGAFLASSTVPAAATHACYSFTITSDYGVALKKSRAREEARASWNKKARAATGTNRVNWKGAKNHQWDCYKNDGLRWRCTGRAVPCLA